MRDCSFYRTTEKAQHGQPCVAKLPSRRDRGVVEVKLLQNKYSFTLQSIGISGLTATISHACFGSLRLTSTPLSTSRSGQALQHKSHHTPIIPTRPPRFLKPRRSSRSTTVDSSVGAHCMRPQFNITAPLLSVSSPSNLSIATLNVGGLRRGWSSFFNAVFPVRCRRNGAFVFRVLADKRKLESGSFCFRNPFSVCKYPNAKPGTDLFWGRSNKCLDVKPEPADFPVV